MILAFDFSSEFAELSKAAYTAAFLSYFTDSGKENSFPCFSVDILDGVK